MLYKQVLGTALAGLAIAATASDKGKVSDQCVADYSVPSISASPSCQFSHRLLNSPDQPEVVYVIAELSGNPSLNISAPVFSVSLSQLAHIKTAGEIVFLGEGMSERHKRQVCGLVKQGSGKAVVFLLQQLNDETKDELARKIFSGEVGISFSEKVTEDQRISLIRKIPVKATSDYLDKILVTNREDIESNSIDIAWLENQIDSLNAIKKGRSQAFASCGKVVNVLD